MGGRSWLGYGGKILSFSFKIFGSFGPPIKSAFDSYFDFDLSFDLENILKRDLSQQNFPPASARLKPFSLISLITKLAAFCFCQFSYQ